MERIAENIFKEIEKWEQTDFEEECYKRKKEKCKEFPKIKHCLAFQDKIMKYLCVQKEYKIKKEEKEKISLFLSQNLKFFMRSII